MRGILKKIILVPFIFTLCQNFCRWKTWNIKNFPTNWTILSFKCDLLGFILGSQKCPSCNTIESLYSYESYDALTVYCNTCGAEYYECAGFIDFGIHSACVIDKKY
jgi:hypothetical protein